MAHIRQEVYKEIKENSLDEIIFVDPFTETTRKAKRNLMVASFITVLVALLELKISGFLGITAESTSLGKEITQGLACIVVMYLFSAFAFGAYIDYSAWQYKRERLLTKPYLKLIELLEQQISVTAEQITNAAEPLRNHIEWSEPEMQYEIDTRQRVVQTLNQITQIENRLSEITSETRPLIECWRKTITAASRLHWRLRARFLGLWSLDIVLPTTLSIVAILETLPNVGHVIARLSS
tara:strand:- start:1687 stop:2400 length:714 start_codon:yes stop_codon:yes gene_type:complete